MNTGKLRPGILLDRDGTIIQEHGRVGKREQVHLIPGAAEAIASFNAAGIPVAVVTNQGGVAYGYYTIDDVMDAHAYLAELLASHGAHVDAYIFCPYHPNGTVPAFTRHSEDRKPRPGMGYAAGMILDLDLNRSFMVGDRTEDMGLAARINSQGIHVGSNPYSLESSVVSFPDLAAAAPYILGRLSQ